MFEWFFWLRSTLGTAVDSIEYGTRGIVGAIMPFIRFMSDANIYFVVTIFVILTLYMFIMWEQQILDKLMNSRNYFAVLIMFGVYMFFAQAEGIKLGGGYTLQLQSIVLPMAAKLLGPVLGSFVSMILYMASFWLGKVPFNVNMLFISGISGIIYGWILYARPTSFWRCLFAKFAVTVFCNILLYPYLAGIPAEPEYLTYAIESVTFSVTQNIIMIPVHTVFIYIELLIMRYIRAYLSDSAWSLKN